MSTEDLFAALGDSFQLAEDDGNLSVGSFGDNDNNLDFSSELVFADLDKEDNGDNNPPRSPQKTQAPSSGGGNNSQNNSNHGSNHGSMSSMSGGTGLAVGLPPPPSMMSSMNNSMSNSLNSSFRGPGTTGTSSAALQNAAATIQGSSRFAFAQQHHSGASFNNVFMSQTQQQQFRPNNQGLTNNNLSNNMNNSMNRSNSMNAPMQMNRSSSMQSSMMNNNSRMNNNSGNNGSMGNATFNNPMPPPSRSPMTTPSISSNSMFKNSFNNNVQQQQQHQTSNAFFQQTNPNSLNWNNELEKPKRPLSAFEFFVQERKRLGALSDSQLQVIWKDQLDTRQKNIYLQQSRADRQRYITELKLWKARTERNQPAGALGNFLKARLQGSKTDLQQVEANKRGRLQPAIVSCPNLNVSPSARLQAMQQQQMGYQGGGSQNATFDNFQQPMQRHSQGTARPMSRFVAHQMQRLQQGRGLADLASELGDDCTTAFVSAMMPRSQSASVVQHGSNSLRFKQQQSSPNMQQDPNMMDPLMEFQGF
mmetsp:Transcript_17006/g.34241  ORF Transcript_17006/g.34241 Transcript_17006/m.34241 type:complete len:533 (-) Transcript_17006:114-1712(-)|eukprot:scaffold34595_cov160-Amphora_coffeaeformis.AAC.4